MTNIQSQIGIIGVGYVGLALATSFVEKGIPVIGVEKSDSRINKIRGGDFDGTDQDRKSIADALDSQTLKLTDDFEPLKQTKCIVLCLPTPTNENHEPDYSILAEVCAQVVELAQSGQTIILTSTSFIGTTQQLLVEPLESKGFEIGKDIFIAFSPERVDPGNANHRHSEVDRVLAGTTEECFNSAYSCLRHAVEKLHRASSLEAAEMTKLLENSFRAVNIAWINEMANLAALKSLNISEIVELAATKPYGYMKFTPGSGAGGHCIPADPHYLLMDTSSNLTPITALAMDELHRRPGSIARQASEMLSSLENRKPKILVWGVAYKPNVSDVRESPALGIISELLEQDIETEFHDPYVPEVSLNSFILKNVPQPNFNEYDLVILHTIHGAGVPEEFFESAQKILDTTFKFAHRDGVVTPS